MSTVRLVIVVKGGMITAIASDSTNVEIKVIDHDVQSDEDEKETEWYAPDLKFTDNEMERFIKEQLSGE